MKEKKETILFGGIVILIVGLIIGVWLFKNIREYDESQKLKEYAEQICMAFENGDITTFDELCDDETVFWEQNYIYSFLREELKYNLEHKKYRVTGYWVSDTNETGIELFSLYIVYGNNQEKIDLDGYITIKRKGKKLVINHFSLADSSINQIHYEIVGSRHPNFNLGPALGY